MAVPTIASNFQQTPQLMGVVIQGLIMGMKSKLLFAYQFELNWGKPVSQIRRELDISGLIE